MLPAILTPRFARLDDYLCGLWAMAEDRFMGLWRSVQGIDLAAHIATHGKDELRAIAEKVPVAGGTNIAVIRVAGVLMKAQMSMGGTSTIQIRREIRQAAADPDVGGILLLIDSPGGTVAGTSDLADDVKAAGKIKPVWSQVDDLAASAAYWVASQTQRIIANSSTALVGSIGTLQTVYDESQAAEKAGIRAIVLKTGSLKGLGTPGAPITEEQITHLQQLVDAVQTSFDAAVRGGRNLSAKELAAVRHGGVMMADDAKAARLIDAIQPLSRTLNQLTQAIKGAGMAAHVRGGIVAKVRAMDDEEEDKVAKANRKAKALEDDEEPEAAEDDEETPADEETEGETLPEEDDEEDAPEAMDDTEDDDEPAAMDDEEDEPEAADGEDDMEDDEEGGTLPEEDDEEADPEAMDDEEEEDEPAARIRKRK